jgi:DNA-binding CsgD family transcriptional regulator
MRRKTQTTPVSKKEKEIIQLIKEGKTAGYIAEKLETFKHVVRDIAKNNKLKLNHDIADSRDFFGRVKGRKNRYVLNDRDAEIKKFLDEGKTYSFIGKKFNLTQERVRQIATKFGVKRWEDKKNYDQNIIGQINVDIADGLSYDEIVKKHNLKQSDIYRLEKRGLQSLAKFFNEKRNGIILEEFKNGKSATQIVKSRNKFLKGKSKIKSINRVYQIAADNNIYKHPEIGNRSAGGCFEDERILRLIKVCRDDQELSFEEIKKSLNKWGKRTVTGKKFSVQNVIAKYNMAKKHLA